MSKKAIFTTILLLIFLVAFQSQAFALQIEGVVLSRKGPVPDALVTAYQDYASLRSGENGVISTPGEKPGQYRLKLPEGKYYLVATGTEEGTELFGYHGLNPIHLAKEYQWVPILVQPKGKVECGPGFQGLGGQVLYNGTPVPDSSITVYSLTDEPFRGMGVLTNTAYEDGSFWFDLDPGTYVVIARKRFGQGAIGPVRRGDLLCYFSGNPVEVPQGQECSLDILCHPRDDVDAFFVEDARDPRGRKEEKRRAASLREADETDSTRQLDGQDRTPAFISGRVTDLGGRPLGDLYVTAYPAGDVKLFQMYILRLRTEYMTRTDANGFFRLELGSGEYYLVARERVGDAPIAGEHYGIYEGTPNHSLVLGPGEVKTGVHIVAESIMP